VTGIQGYIDDELNARVQGLAARSAGVAADSISWQPYADELVDRAAHDGKPVFIDFYADWCIPCKELDKSTFVDPEVVAASRSFVMLKGNLTSTNDPKVKAVTEKFQVRGVPTLVFLSADGKEMTDLRGTGFEKKEVFLPKMLKTLEASRKK
jgi:thioredoxin:protein disulfide reductase